MAPRVATTFLAALLFACVTATPVRPTIVEVLPDGYIVDGVAVATPSALRAYIVASGVHEVRVVPHGTASYERTAETFATLADLGLSFGITGSERK